MERANKAMTPAEKILAMTEQQLRELAVKHLSGPGPWEHDIVLGKDFCLMCRQCGKRFGDYLDVDKAKAAARDNHWVCLAPMPLATGSLADIAKGLKDEVKKRNAHQALWDVIIDGCKYADDGDGLAWLYWHSTLHEEVAVLLAALEGKP